MQLLPAARKIHPDDLDIIKKQTTLTALLNCHSTPAAKKMTKHHHRDENFSEQELEELKICCASSLAITMTQ